MSTSEQLLDFISNPDIAYVLLMLGMLGIYFELFNPGAVLPGVVGVISLILAFYAMNTLPVNYAGLMLIIFSLVLFLLEIKVVSHGVLAIGGYSFSFPWFCNVIQIKFFIGYDQNIYRNHHFSYCFKHGFLSLCNWLRIAGTATKNSDRN